MIRARRCTAGRVVVVVGVVVGGVWGGTRQPWRRAGMQPCKYESGPGKYLFCYPSTPLRNSSPCSPCGLSCESHVISARTSTSESARPLHVLLPTARTTWSGSRAAAAS